LCGTQLGATAKFCSECGTPISHAALSAEYKQVTVLFAKVLIRLGETKLTTAGSRRRKTRLLYGVRWNHLSQARPGRLEGEPPIPGARAVNYRGIRTEQPMSYWEYPVRNWGNRLLHVRLALSEKDRQRYAEAEEHWWRVGVREWNQGVREWCTQTRGRDFGKV
jgi:hypothetical protein